MTLNHDERHSALWMKLNEHLQSEIDRLRKKNDSNSLSELDTAHLRGQIRALKDVAALATDLPQVAND